jgi:hypothetical protein
VVLKQVAPAGAPVGGATMTAGGTTKTVIGIGRPQIFSWKEL